ncbi:rRNA maturation RNase YbeY [Flavihumibacter profundi]|uniref:rRNA maturation RNase YbeY n=1 Tax=Flavihumibacter profundi TaxID=2716883 RepID=UPI001CC50750|nr:rRNA maturation RNase YbeY [Flavihumibacter profundi]MBZ5859066.1 rRNA maturation RNase YbeY [Flavihumibacter profundi]
MEKATDIIQFHYQAGGFHFSNRNACKGFLQMLFKQEKKKLANLNYIFCSDEYLLAINRDFLQHDYYTDIVTFELNDPGTPISGEIYISIDRIRDNAKNLEESFTRELHRVIFHGALHLCGYRDKTQEEEKLMRKMEDKYLSAYFSK